MPLRIEPNEEPIAGYRLIDRLGSGGFGEVWKAEAPGGLFKAIKFVQCEKTAENASSCILGGPGEGERSRADQELKSLSRVKSVHHPYVISLDRFEIVDDFLVIVMELADRTLADRFKQCRGQGLPGLPREELLNYLREAAEALDLMNSQYQLQHLDIKPQNLFLVHNHIKVADFGLVKDISDQKFMTITGGVTPVYAAPETFDGKFSRQSDQYSLAIVYQEMLTGHRPFTGTTMKQLILQHLQNAHDLTPTPVHDRPIIAKALSKNPEDRYANCLDFIDFLQRATLKSGGTPTPFAPSPPPPAPAERAHPSLTKTQGARGGEAKPVKPADPNFSIAKAFLRDAPSRPSAPAPSSAAEPDLRTSMTPKQVSRSSTPVRPAQESSGIVQPALIVGIGQIGVETLAQLKKRIAAELGSVDAVSHLRVVGIDTDAGTLQDLTQGTPDSALRPQETFHARLLRPSHYIKTRDGKLPTDNWLNPKVLYRIPREQTSASVRALGRLALVDNYRIISKRLDAELTACCSQDTPHDLDPACDLGLRTTKPRVYLVTSLTGSTGSGMFLDIAYLLRQLLTNHGHGDAEVVGLFYLPAVGREPVLAPVLANAYASLVELQYYCKPNAHFSALYETAANAGKGERVSASGPAIHRCVLFSLPTPKGKINPESNAPIIAQVGDYLYRELATPMGIAADKARANTAPVSVHDHNNQFPQLQSIGMYQVVWPRHALLEQAARRLCNQLVTRWLSKDPGAAKDVIRQWTQERWESLGLRPEGLIERFQQVAEESLNQKPELLLAEILVPVQEMAAAAKKAAAKNKPVQVNMGPVVETMDRLEKMLGLPDDGRGHKPMNTEPALLERTLAEITHALADDCEQKLAELAVTLLEDPNYRLAGAEEALRQFCTTVDQALVSQEALGKELAEKTAQLHLRVQQAIDSQSPTGDSTHWAHAKTHRKLSSPALSPNDLFELVRAYTKTRYHSLVLGHLNRLYLGLRGHLSDQIREVGFCRQRLGELLGLLKPPPPKGPEPTRADQRVLFPAGCRDLKDAVEKLSQTIVGEDLLRFDERMQHWIHNHCQALLQICMGASSMVRNLVPVMLHEAERYLDERLNGASVAEMYLARAGASASLETDPGDGDDSVLIDDVQGCIDDATPEFGRIGHENLITLVNLPNDEHGAELKQILQKQFREAKIQLTERQDEMIFFREIDHIHWKDVEQMGPIGLEAYTQRCSADPSSVHSREDVFEWRVIAECRR